MVYFNIWIWKYWALMDIIKNMKSYQLLLVVLLVASAAGFTAKNTTKFWENQLKLNTTLGFQAYAGKVFLMQAISRLIGTILRTPVACSTTYLELKGTMSCRLLPMFLSSSGCRAALGLAPSLEPSQRWALSGFRRECLSLWAIPLGTSWGT